LVAIVVVTSWGTGVSRVVLEPEVGDLFLTLEIPQGILQFHLLDEEIVLGVESAQVVRALEEEGQPLLDAVHAAALGQVHQQDQVQDDGGGQDAVAAEEIDLDLHGVAHPAEDVDVVPPFLVVAAGRVVVDPHLVVKVLVQLGVEVRLQDLLQHGQLAGFLGLEGVRIVQHFAVPVAQDVGGEPAGDADEAGLQPGRQDGLHQGLAGLEVLAGDGHLVLLGQLLERRGVHGQVGGPVGVGDAQLQRGVGVHHAGGDVRVVLLEPFLQRLDALMYRRLLDVDLRGAAPDHDQAAATVLFLEAADVVHHHLGQVPLGGGLLDVGAVQLLDVLAVEDRLHRLDLLEFLADWGEILRLEHSRVGGRLVGGVGEDVPPAEHQLVEAGQGDEILDQRGFLVSALADPDGAHLGQ
jgi:hypothetical protein